MGLFRRNKRSGTSASVPQSDEGAQVLIGSLMTLGEEFAAEHNLGSTSEDVARADAILQERLDANPSDEEKMHLHRQVTGYLYGTVVQNFPDWAFITGAPDNPVAMRVGDHDNGVQVLGWSKVQGRIDNGPEDHLQFFYDGIARYLQEPGVQTLM